MLNASFFLLPYVLPFFLHTYLYLGCSSKTTYGISRSYKGLKHKVLKVLLNKEVEENKIRKMEYNIHSHDSNLCHLCAEL